MNKKPAGLIAIIVYNIFGAIMSLGLGGLLMLAGSMPQMPAAIGGFSLLLILFGVVGAVASYGLWNLEEWGRVTTIVVYGLSIPFSLYTGLTDEGINSKILNIGSVLIEIFIIGYLMKKQIIMLFKKDRIVNVSDKCRDHQVISVKYCEKCGSEMKIRVKQSGDDAGTSFWVCNQYSTCKNCFPC